MGIRILPYRGGYRHYWYGEYREGGRLHQVRLSVKIAKVFLDFVSHCDWPPDIADNSVSHFASSAFDFSETPLPCASR